jgi:hypothetical protein
MSQFWLQVRFGGSKYSWICSREVMKGKEAATNELNNCFNLLKVLEYYSPESLWSKLPTLSITHSRIKGT